MTLNNKMKAVFMTAFGDASCLEIREIKKPVIDDNEILVKVIASSVNPVDWKVRRGDVKFITGSKLPRQLGADYSGVVENTGKHVKNFNRGDEVFGMINAFNGNTYSEFIRVRENQIAIKPVNLNFIEAATMPLVGLTIYQLFFQITNLPDEAKVLINGCSGGIGHIAVQIAKNLNFHVTGVCSAKNASYAKSIGVDCIIDYNKENILAKKNTYDLFFDAVANTSFKEAKHTLKSNGEYVSSIPSFQNLVLAPIFNLISRKKNKKLWVKPDAENLRSLSTLIENKIVKPTIEKVYPIEDIINAHRHSETGTVVGKIALTIREVN